MSRRDTALARERKRMGLERTAKTLTNSGLGLTPSVRRAIGRQDHGEIARMTRGTLRGAQWRMA